MDYCFKFEMSGKCIKYNKIKGSVKNDKIKIKIKFRALFIRVDPNKVVTFRTKVMHLFIYLFKHH